MSENVIKISTLLKEVIAEAGDLRNIEPLQHDKSKQTFQVPYKGQEYVGKVTFTFLNKQGLGLFKLPPIVSLDSIYTGYNVGYSIEGVSSQFIKSDIKLLLAILKTVSVIVGDFVSKHPQAIYFIFAENKTGIGFDDSQKLAIYQQILGHNLPKGFRMGKAEIEGIAQGLFIVKNN